MARRLPIGLCEPPLIAFWRSTYGMAAFIKPVFPMAQSLDWLVGARIVVRIRKGIRGAPRDALVVDIAPPVLRGASFGLRQSLDTTGAFLGPLLAIALMVLSGNNFQFVFWIAVIPAFVALALMMFAVSEPKRPVELKRVRLKFSDIARFPRVYWAIVAVAAVLTLARFSQAFLVLRAQNAGLAIALIPMVLVVMNVVYALSAYPAGVVADKAGRAGGLMFGIVCLIVADIVFAFTTGIWGVMAGIALWGLHMGLTQGLLAALVADIAPADLRGTAFGVFNFAIGVAMLLASVIASGLWDIYGAQATFMFGAVVAGVTLAGVATLRMTQVMK
jgi:MFS family permease